MASNYREWFVQLIDGRTKKPLNDDAGLYSVFQAGVPLNETCYSDQYGTSLTLPGTMTDGIIQFWMDSATTSCDLSIMTSGGKAFFIEGLAQTDHRVEVDPYRETFTLVGTWAILSAHADGTVSAVKAPVSGGPPAGLRIKDVYIHKTAVGVGVGAGLVVDFGVSGDPDGFIDGMTATATGYSLNNWNFTTLSDLSVPGNRFVTGTQTRGILLGQYSKGIVTAVSAAGAKGFVNRSPYMISLVTTTNNLVFAITGTSALTTVAGSRGYVFYEYDIIPTAGN